jgi:hypothetical protein
MIKKAVESEELTEDYSFMDLSIDLEQSTMIFNTMII